MSAHANLKLRIIPLDELRPHEETVPHLSDRLIRTMIRDGVQRDPVIVDEASKIILDGMHRARALGKMGAHNAVCYTLDYMRDDTRLFSWFRFVEGPGQEVVEGVMRELGAVKEVEVPKRGVIPESGFLITYMGRAYSSEGALTSDEVAGLARAFDAAVRTRGALVRYMDEARASPDLLRGAYLTLLVPRLTKHDVVRRGKEGSLLPPKTTLHVFPARPMGINYPISFLTDGTDVLERMVSSRRTRVIEAPSFYHGRLYREPVVVFE